ncbi:FHA domain-containing protein [Frigoribacterium sp. PvP032]|uniref:FHA domain-containing protein n=1 Tax=Frigoribacterium sp. PvP032 TaxID=2806589 RepID=UPI001AE10F14|nr:FHA domain-containing protein [Frigoribacterium sp. PvP032]MBP1190192.1 hypothetical protein [Frigoribacterium sp. PvP032]
MTSSIADPAVPSVTCARCGAGTAPRSLRCADCGSPAGPPRARNDDDAPAGLRGTRPASSGRVLLGRALDLLTLAAGAAAGAGVLALLDATVSGDASPRGVVVGALLGALASACVVAASWSRRGRALGGLVARTREVDGADGLPLRLRLVPARLVGRGPARGHDDVRGPLSRRLGTVVADLTTGRDPSAVVPASSRGTVRTSSGDRLDDRRDAVADDLGDLERTVSSAGTDTRRPRADQAPRPVGDGTAAAPSDEVRLRFRSGLVHVFTGAAVVGRGPAAPDGAVPLAVPDLSRTLSKSHASLVRRGDVVVLTDLGSTNGTTVRTADGGVVPVSPGTEAELRPGAVVSIGDHEFALEFAPDADVPAGGEGQR